MEDYRKIEFNTAAEIALTRKKLFNLKAEKYEREMLCLIHEANDDAGNNYIKLKAEISGLKKSINALQKLLESKEKEIVNNG